MADLILDAWENARTGLGGVRDKGTASVYNTPTISDADVFKFWQGNGVAATVIESVPLIIASSTLELSGDDPEQVQLVSDAFESLDVMGALQQAHEYDRAYGGAAILIVAADADQLQPLAPNAPIVRLLVYPRTVFTPGALSADVFAANYGLPETYKFSDLKLEVHWSRVILFRGSRPYDAIFGASELVRAVEAIQRWQVAHQNAGALTHELVVRYLKLGDLHTKLASPGGKDVLRAKLQSIDTYRSIFRTTVLDKTDEFQHVPVNTAGIAELVASFERELVTATRIPKSVLFSDGPTGLNSATASDNDLKLWAMRLRAMRKEKWEPAITRVVRQLLASNGGEPVTWNYTLSDMDPLNAAELAQARQQQSSTDVAYINAGVLTPEEVAISRFSSVNGSFETTVDLEARAALATPPVGNEAP